MAHRRGMSLKEAGRKGGEARVVAARQGQGMSLEDAGRKGGKVAHERGTAHEWTPEEARMAGKRGGQIAHQRGTAHEWSSEEARKAGRKGGRALSHEEHVRAGR